MTGYIIMNNKTVYIKTYGCQMNEADSQRAAALLWPVFEPGESPEEADVVLINTCSVREKPQQKLLSELGRLRRIKERKGSMIIGIMGCVAQQMKDEIFKRAPWVDLVVGPDGIDDIPQLVAEAQKGQQGTSTTLLRHAPGLDRAVEVKTRKPSALVNVMKGCDKFCTYCIVPYTRGREASRPPQTVMDEISGLVRQGVFDITLLGQNVTAYGRDLGDGASLGNLVRNIIDTEPSVQRIRFITSHPMDTDDETLELFALPRVATYFHLPLQAGSDRVLQAMGRGYTFRQYLDIVNKVRAIRPDIAMASDFIVGFPGETRDDFLRTMDAIEAVEYDMIYSFVYSPRPFTKAAGFDDPVPREEKLQWLQELQARQNEITRQKYADMVGTVQPVIIEGPSSRNPEEMMGRTSCNKVVNLPLPPKAIGTMIDVRITEAMSNSLRGETVEMNRDQ